MYYCGYAALWIAKRERTCESKAKKKLRPEESQSPFLQKAFHRVYEFSPFNEILRKWIVTEYFNVSLHYWSANTHFQRVDRDHAYLQGRSRRIVVCTHICMYLLSDLRVCSVLLQLPSILLHFHICLRVSSARPQGENKVNQRDAENN